MDLEDRVRRSLRDRAAEVQDDATVWDRILHDVRRPGRTHRLRTRLFAALAAVVVAAAGIAFAVNTLSRTVVSAGKKGGGGIAFVMPGPKSGPGVDNTDIYLIERDGTHLRNLTDDAAAERSPAWTPDGRQVAFIRASFEGGRLQSGVYVMYGDGSDMHEIRPCASDRCGVSDLAWSPDGSHLAFVEDASKGNTPFQALKVMNSDGSGTRVLCGDLDACGQGLSEPAWSPDGRRIVFSNLGSFGIGLVPSAIRVVNADGTGLRKLTDLTCHPGHNPMGPCPYFDTAPAWSPDGRWIAFSRHLAGIPRFDKKPSDFAHFGDTHLEVIRPDGSGLRTLADCRSDLQCSQVMRPAWSPLGTEIGYVPAVSQAPEIAIVEVASGRVRTLRTCLSMCVQPYGLAWSPDGGSLAFLSDERFSSLFSIQTDGAGMRKLAFNVDATPTWLPGPRPSGPPGNVSPSGDGLQTVAPSLLPGSIAFAHYSDDNEEAVDIFTVRSDGTDQRALTSNPHFDGEPAWSSDGSRIAFTTYRGSSSKTLYVMNADGMGQGPIPVSQAVSEPAWSPDGTQFAFVSEGPGAILAISVVSSDGTNLRRITTGVQGDSAPAWSPDGSTIAFDRSAGSDSGIYLVNPDGTGLRRLADLPGSAGQPAWSPDGRELAFRWSTAGGEDLYVIRSDGTGLRRLTNLPGSPSSPTWSPDGSRIAFAYSETAFQGGIYTIAADGPGLARVVGGGGAYFDPAWQPMR